MLQALQKHNKVLQVTTLQKVAIKNVILSGNPVSRDMVYQKMTQWSPKTSYLDISFLNTCTVRNMKDRKKEKFYFDFTRCIKKNNNKKEE